MNMARQDSGVPEDLASPLNGEEDPDLTTNSECNITVIHVTESQNSKALAQNKDSKDGSYSGVEGCSTKVPRVRSRNSVDYTSSCGLDEASCDSSLVSCCSVYKDACRSTLPGGVRLSATGGEGGKTGRLPALATASSTELTEKENTLIPNATRDVDENSVISVSTITNILQDVNIETPRLVDHILMAQKKKKNSKTQENGRKETLSEKSRTFREKSVLAMPIKSFNHDLSIRSKELESEKENYLRCGTPHNVVFLSPATSSQSITSNRSGPFDRNSPISALSSTDVAGYKFPLKATCAALAWNSVKIGKSEVKEFSICNTSNNKIKIKMDILDSENFKFLGDKQTNNTSMVLEMEPQEINILVAFSPCCVGPIVGKIDIYHYTRESNDSQQSRKISLYGYGGYSKVKIADTFKDLSGNMLLRLENLNKATTWSANFRLDNIGDLRSFAKITVIPKVCSPMNSSLNINPKEVILNPKESQQIVIQLHLKKRDVAIFRMSEVSHVATIKVTYGDEPTRWRIRRLYNKIKESGDSTVNKNEAFKNIVHPICKVFPGEQSIPAIASIRDSAENLSDLCTGVHQSEIMLTVEACADDTLLAIHYDDQRYIDIGDIKDISLMSD